MTQFSPDALQDIKSSQYRVFLQECAEPVMGACQNCGGIGSLWLQFETLERGSGVSCAFIGSDRINVRSKTYPCPICAQGDRDAQREYAWNNSGLELAEREWRVEYIAGMSGKERAIEAAHGLLAQSPSPIGLVSVFGDYGRGKTGLLKSLTAQFILAGVSARYVRAGDLLGEIRSTYSTKQTQFGYEANEITEEQILARVGSVRFLAVDEVDRIPSTDWAMSTMMRVLDTRYSRRWKCATMIATNLRPDAMPPEWGYLQSRLSDGLRVPVGGDDLRGQ